MKFGMLYCGEDGSIILNVVNEDETIHVERADNFVGDDLDAYSFAVGPVIRDGNKWEMPDSSVWRNENLAWENKDEILEIIKGVVRKYNAKR